jgi:hypothetical protein
MYFTCGKFAKYFISVLKGLSAFLLGCLLSWGYPCVRSLANCKYTMFSEIGCVFRSFPQATPEPITRMADILLGPVNLEHLVSTINTQFVLNNLLLYFSMLYNIVYFDWNGYMEIED